MTAYLDLETYFFNSSGNLTEILFSVILSFLFATFFGFFYGSLFSPHEYVFVTLQASLVLNLWSNSQPALPAVKSFISKRDELV